MKNPVLLKKIIFAVWITFLLFCIGFFLAYPQNFKPQAIADFLVQFQNTILLSYFIISILRGFTLIPSTPFVLAGTILYPTDPFLILTISILGIIFSSTLIYYFSDYLGFTEYFERKHSQKIVKIHNQLEKPGGIIFVFLWAFFPLLPTDLVCYVAGGLKMNFTKFILAITGGELILCSIYIFFTQTFVKLGQFFG